MINIDEIKVQIIEKLKPFEPKKIILFGSFAYGNPNENSDIDLFIIKNLEDEKVREYKLNLRKHVRSLISKYKVGFDFVVANEDFLNKRNDYFYKNEILEKGIVIYE